ncbi:glycosyltransferase family 2 protein [Flavobacterium sp. DSR3-2]|uniref:glycosyltransferase family 2 protein n=1 Tax=Flavobacterium sp. DSR3-2 TaxID=2804634 RepID=UPI003CEC18DB
MQDNPLVTIICLCYNQEEYVLESLFSVVNQNYAAVELIIVDDCSSDNSKAAIENWLLDFPKIQFIANEINLGSTKSFNKALKKAKGEFIIDLAADDILLFNCVTSQINAFKNTIYKNLGVVYGNAELISEKGIFNSYYFPVDRYKKVIKQRATGDIYYSVLSGGDCMCSVSSMVKKSAFDHLNGYDETLEYEDLDLWIRASQIYDFDFIDEILIRKRTVQNSLGTHFFMKNDARARKINQSTYLIIKKVMRLNRTKNEDKALLKRIHFEIILNNKTTNYTLLLKYILLEIKLRLRFLNII